MVNHPTLTIAKHWRRQIVLALDRLALHSQGQLHLRWTANGNLKQNNPEGENIS